MRYCERDLQDVRLQRKDDHSSLFPKVAFGGQAAVVAAAYYFVLA